MRIVAIDEAGARSEAVVLEIAAGTAAHFNPRDLEEGNPDKGIVPPGLDLAGEGDWRLELESTLDFEALSYVRTRGEGVLANVHDVVPEDEGGHRVVFFNPASNLTQMSRLRLVNPGAEAAAVRIEGIDDAGDAGESAVELTLGGGASRSLDARALETGRAKGLPARSATARASGACG